MPIDNDPLEQDYDAPDGDDLVSAHEPVVDATEAVADTAATEAIADVPATDAPIDPVAHAEAVTDAQAAVPGATVSVANEIAEALQNEGWVEALGGKEDAIALVKLIAPQIKQYGGLKPALDAINAERVQAAKVQEAEAGKRRDRIEADGKKRLDDHIESVATNKAYQAALRKLGREQYDVNDPDTQALATQMIDEMKSDFMDSARIEETQKYTTRMNAAKGFYTGENAKYPNANPFIVDMIAASLEDSPELIPFYAEQTNNHATSVAEAIAQPLRAENAELKRQLDEAQKAATTAKTDAMREARAQLTQEQLKTGKMPVTSGGERAEKPGAAAIDRGETALQRLDRVLLRRKAAA